MVEAASEYTLPDDVDLAATLQPVCRQDLSSDWQHDERLLGHPDISWERLEAFDPADHIVFDMEGSATAVYPMNSECHVSDTKTPGNGITQATPSWKMGSLSYLPSAQHSAGETVQYLNAASQEYTDVLPAIEYSPSALNEGKDVQEAPFMCTVPDCPASRFKRRADLKRHMKSLHGGYKLPQFPCPVLGCHRTHEFGFTREDKLKDHLRSVHSKSIPKKNDGSSNTEVQVYISDPPVPGSITSLPLASRQPPLIPTKRAPYGTRLPCAHPDCGKVFFRHCDLRRHAKTHLSREERPHKCPMCNERFLYPKDCARHLRCHGDTSESRYRCSVAGCSRNAISEAFKHMDHLQQHIHMMHPGTDVPAVISTVTMCCSFCDREFSRKDNLRRHLRTMHPEKSITASEGLEQMRHLQGVPLDESPVAGV